MATFTMYLKEVVESLYHEGLDTDDYEQEYNSVTVDGVTYGSLPVLDDYTPLGLGTYPIFNEPYRKVLNGKILDEYWNREIGVETIDLFKHTLRKKMDQIMPFYNKMYESEKIPYEALETMRIQSVGSVHEEAEETQEATGSTDTTTTSGSRAITSNFPQTMLAGNADYASAGTDTNGSSAVFGQNDSSNTSSSSQDGERENLVTGYQGAASDLVVKYRNSLLNIDTMVLAEIEDCFMLVFNNGNEYFARESFNWSY